MPKIISISSKKFCKLLILCGCELIRSEGDHTIFWKEGIIRPIVVPIRKDLPVFIVLNNIKTLGISKEEYIQLLKKI